jgi:diguanylate cyclase (GGDEF)-like protein
MSGLRTLHALTANALILATLILVGTLGLLPAPVAIYLGFALLCANIIGTAGAYSLEHANRTSFLERRLLLEVAELDGLTHLLNRQTFESRVRIAWRRATTSGLTVTVLMIDVDHFKLYNDHYGHQAGDDCLRRVASTVRTAVSSRVDDCLARYGGEELIALVIGRDPDAIQEVAQRIVGDVGGLEIPHAGSTGGYVSVSVGAATLCPPSTSSYDAIVRLADDALYAAKRQGRNRSVVVEARASAVA